MQKESVPKTDKGGTKEPVPKTDKGGTKEPVPKTDKGYLYNRVILFPFTSIRLSSFKRFNSLNMAERFTPI